MITNTSFKPASHKPHTYYTQTALKSAEELAGRASSDLAAATEALSATESRRANLASLNAGLQSDNADLINRNQQVGAVRWGR